MHKTRKMATCRVCNMSFDPKESARIFGKIFVEMNPNICSSRCYTKMKNNEIDKLYIKDK